MASRHPLAAPAPAAAAPPPDVTAAAVGPRGDRSGQSDWQESGVLPFGGGGRGCGAGVPAGRGLHSSTFQLNVSAYCGIGGAFRGCLRSV